MGRGTRGRGKVKRNNKEKRILSSIVEIHSDGITTRRPAIKRGTGRSSLKDHIAPKDI